MKFSWKVALVRWVNGVVTGSIGGLVAVQTGEMSWNGFWITVSMAFLTAVKIDLDSWLKAREGLTK